MNHCLVIPELVLHIIHFLADDRPTWHGSRYLRNSRDLARLARTCKALSEPALDVLWRTQHSLSPLVMCLPSDVWELTRHGKSICFRREPTLQDLATINKYSHRVRFISQPTPFSLPRLDDAALATIIAPSNFGALFPSLRALDYAVISVTSPMIQLLMNVLSTERHLETLTSLGVICPKSSKREQVYSLFQAIRTKATRLETLRIESFTSAPSDSSLAVTLSEGEFKFLRKLDLSWTIRISAECLACLAGMEYLQEMNLCVHRDIDLEFLANGPYALETKGQGSVTRKRTFPVLRSIKVMAYALNQCTALLSLVTSSLLEIILFSYDTQASSSLIETFFHQVQNTSSHLHRPVSLTLKHNLGPLSSPTPPYIVHPSQTLSPLLSVSHLRTLRLLHLGTFAIDDEFLREAANVWGAHLQELEECGIPWIDVEESKDLPGFAPATLDGVGAFVTRCTRLEKLRLAFDGRRLPCDDARFEEARENTNSSDPNHHVARSSSVLQVLNVRDSPIDDPERVARFMKRIAPGLRVICIEGSMDMWKKWREVEDRMKSMGGCY